VPFLPLVHFHDIFCVDGQAFVRIDDDTEQARIGLKKKEKSEEVSRNKTSSLKTISKHENFTSG
jgi:hypothetical protein